MARQRLVSGAGEPSDQKKKSLPTFFWVDSLQAKYEETWQIRRSSAFGWSFPTNWEQQTVRQKFTVYCRLFGIGFMAHILDYFL